MRRRRNPKQAGAGDAETKEEEKVKRIVVDNGLHQKD